VKVLRASFDSRQAPDVTDSEPFLGTHIKIPWFETPIDYDVRAKPRNVASLTGTKDLQMVNITCRVLSRPRIDALSSKYTEHLAQITMSEFYLRL